MKHEDYRLRYNEIMFDERDQIKSFLEQQADLRYGNQMYEWTLEPAPELLSANGAAVKVIEVRLDKNDIVLFTAETACGLERDWKCYDFALGELSKIIDALPDANDIILKNAESDLTQFCHRHNGNVDLDKHPFSWKDGKSTFYVHHVYIDTQTGKLGFEVREDIDGVPGCENNWGLWDDGIPALAARDLTKHIRAVLLRESPHYTRLKKCLSQFGGDCYSFRDNNNVGDIYLTPSGSDLQLNVLDVCFQDGELLVLVSIADTRLCSGDDTMLLHESDLTPANLKVILDFFGEPSVEEKIAFTEEQLTLIAEWKSLRERMKNANLGFVRENDNNRIYFINTTNVEDTHAIDRELSNDITKKLECYDVLRYLDGPHDTPEVMHFYPSDGETIYVTFIGD